MARYFYVKDDKREFPNASIRAMYEDSTRCVIEYSDGAIDDSWRESTLEEMEQDFGFNPFEPQPQPEPQPEPKPQVEYISREDFDLLDVTYKSVTYYIEEQDGTITMKRGEE